MPETVHVMLTDYGKFGWGISSPQLPELIGGRSTKDELLAELDQLLEFGGADPSSPRVIHVQKHLVLADGDELVIRVANDEQFADREVVAKRIVGVLGDKVQRDSMLSVPRRPTGELLFICAVPSDTLGWVSEQLDVRDASCVTVGVADDMIRTQFIGHGDTGADEGDWVRTSDMGWTDDTTITEIIKAQGSGAASRIVYA